MGDSLLPWTGTVHSTRWDVCAATGARHQCSNSQVTEPMRQVRAQRCLRKGRQSGASCTALVPFRGLLKVGIRLGLFPFDYQKGGPKPILRNALVKNHDTQTKTMPKKYAGFFWKASTGGEAGPKCRPSLTDPVYHISPSKSNQHSPRSTHTGLSNSLRETA